MHQTANAFLATGATILVRAWALDGAGALKEAGSTEIQDIQ